MTRPPRNGDFYIDDITDFLYLREGGGWDKKGKFVRAHIVGLTSEGPFPFTDAQAFELALSETAERYYPAFSASRSEVECIFPTAGACSIVLTDSLSAYLGYGTHVICTATFAAHSKAATLVFNDVIIPARTPLWIVMPIPADATMAGLRCLFASEPV